MLRTFLRFTAQLLFLSVRPLYRKLRFRGKGYYVFKNLRQVVAPQFGFSHRRYFYHFLTKVRFLSKKAIFFFGLTKKDLLLTTTRFLQNKPLNPFTGRGVRFARQQLYRKTGKISSYR
jgi:ribosomal protein L6P/L9E